MIRARYQSDTAVAGKHRRATDATNMSDERPYVREQSLTDGCANGGWRLFSPGRLLFRWLRSAAFTTSGSTESRRAAVRRNFAGTRGTVAGVNRAVVATTKYPAGVAPGPLTLLLIDLAMGLCFNIIVLVTVVEILGAPL